MDYFDLHCDTLTALYKTGETIDCNSGQLDLLRTGSFDRYAQFFAVFTADGISQEEGWKKARDILKKANQKHRILQSKECIQAACPGFFLALENASVIGKQLYLLERCKALNVRYITVTWNGSNLWGNGCLSASDTGLTPLGKRGVSRMEQLGIFTDVSHLNQKGFWDVLETVQSPVLATHTACRTVYNHPRNLSDEQLIAIAQHGGLIGLTLFWEHLGDSTFEQIERHLYHLWETVGPRCVAWGADWDGMTIPSDWKDITVITRIYQYLCRKNYEEKVLHQLFFSNCYDFF